MVTTDRSRFVDMYLSTAGGGEVPVYVGRGTAERVESHGNLNPTTELGAIIESGEYCGEILDCGTSAAAVLVEGALISVMRARSKVDLKNRRLDQAIFSSLDAPMELAG